jgi:hypothetical protein
LRKGKVADRNFKMTENDDFRIEFEHKELIHPF